MKYFVFRHFLTLYSINRCAQAHVMYNRRLVKTKQNKTKHNKCFGNNTGLYPDSLPLKKKFI